MKWIVTTEIQQLTKKEKKVKKFIRLTHKRPDPNNPGNPPWKVKAIALVYEDNYGRSLAKLDRLYAAIRESFPQVTREQVEFRQYSGDRLKRICGLEFEVPYDIWHAENLPAGWQAISELPPA